MFQKQSRPVGITTLAFFFVLLSENVNEDVDIHYCLWLAICFTHPWDCPSSPSTALPLLLRKHTELAVPVYRFLALFYESTLSCFIPTKEKLLLDNLICLFRMRTTTREYWLTTWTGLNNYLGRLPWTECLGWATFSYAEQKRSPFLSCFQLSLKGLRPLPSLW